MSEAAFLMNQKNINGRLCQVDWRLISALREVVAALNAPGQNTVDFASLNGLIDEAGLSFSADLGILNIRLTVQRTGPGGAILSRTQALDLVLRNRS